MLAVGMHLHSALQNVNATIGTGCLFPCIWLLPNSRN